MFLNLSSRMKYLSKVIPAVQEVYTQKRYYFISIISAVVLMSLNALVRNYKLLWSNFSFSLMYSLVVGLWTSFTLGAFIILIIISLLGGVIVSMSVFLLQRQLATSASMGASGIIIAVLAPACPSCALGLFSILGLSGLLAFLPLKGLELGIMGIILLLGTITYISHKIATTVCEVKP